MPYASPEDMPPGSPAVIASRERVDLYGYMSMTVAALQRQNERIDALEAQVDRLSKESAALKAPKKRPAR